tara:strand:- start:164 stop:625 length:462 start_codon:yes stop_codon:yes gene_type:complete|eukprot:scaffold35798_cov33-Phaeocystis_antarctica.AAC.1
MRSFQALGLSRPARVPGEQAAIPAHVDQGTLDLLEVASWVGGCGLAYGRHLSASECVRAHEQRAAGRLLFLVVKDLRRFWQLHQIWFLLSLPLRRRLHHLCASDNDVGLEVVRGARWPEARHQCPEPHRLQRAQVGQTTIATAAAAAAATTTA